MQEIKETSLVVVVLEPEIGHAEEFPLLLHVLVFVSCSVNTWRLAASRADTLLGVCMKKKEREREHMQSHFESAANRNYNVWVYTLVYRYILIKTICIHTTFYPPFFSSTSCRFSLSQKQWVACLWLSVLVTDTHWIANWETSVVSVCHPSKTKKKQEKESLGIHIYSTIANGLFNVVALGLHGYLNLLIQRLVINALDNTDFGVKFLRREENRRAQRKPLEVRLRSTNLSPRTSSGSNLGCSGGRRGWWSLCQSDSLT